MLRYFQALPDYRPGDLITREEVEPLLGQLRRTGLPLPDAKQILEKVPAKDEFLVATIRTPDGRKFMRQISGYRDAYDRLDRLSRLPHGQQTIRDLIRGPDGYKMIEYMTTAPGGQGVGQATLERAAGGRISMPRPAASTPPTMLLRRLEQSRAAALKAARKRLRGFVRIDRHD